MSVYKRLVPRAIDLATKGEYTEDDDFTTDLQDRFKARFGADASSQCAFASMLFSTYRTAHALPYLDTSSREYRERIEEMAKAGLEKEKSGVAKNVMGNSNRLDSAMLFSKLTPSIEQDLPIALSIGWAISLGGDVRSNAYLAGGLSGALWGEEGIPDEWLMFCQGVDEARALADELFTRYSNQ
jgi:ADP-ribosylglycohydrolase